MLKVSADPETNPLLRGILSHARADRPPGLAWAPEEYPMRLEIPERRIIGSSGELFVPAADEITSRLLMLIEGQCEGLGAVAAAQKYGISKQRYFQLLKLFRDQGAPALLSRKPGPQSDHVRTPEVVRQVIRHRFLDPDASAAVIAQKLRQADLSVSTRSVERIIEEYGLQKKTRSLPSPL